MSINHIQPPASPTARVAAGTAHGPVDPAGATGRLSCWLVGTTLDDIERLAPDLPDPHQTALALVTMNIHRMLTLTPGTSDADLDALVNTLATVWERTIITATDAKKPHRPKRT